MNEHDLNRIAAYAAGELGAEEAAAVAELVASEPEARAEYEAQRVALAALEAAPRPMLQDAERTALRRAVAAELHLEPEPEPARPARRRIPWARLAPVAAVLAVVVIAAPLLRTLSVGDDNDSTATIALAPTDAEAVPAASAAQGAAIEERSDAPGADGDDLAAAAAPTTMASATAAGEALVLPDLGALRLEDLEPLRQSLLGVEESALASFLINAALADERPSDEMVLPLNEACPEASLDIVPEGETSVFVGLGTVEGIPATLYLIIPSGDAEPTLAAFGEDCTVLATAGP